MAFSAPSSHPHNMHELHTSAPIFNAVFGLSHHMKKSDDPVNLAIYNSLPVDKIEARLYQRAHAALADPAIQQLPKEAQLPYIAWALRDAERIEPIKNEFAEIGQRADIQQIPTGAISDFLARRTLGSGYRENDGISSSISVGLREGRASQQLNMLAFRLWIIQRRIEDPLPIEIGGDLRDNPKLVHVELQVPDRVAPQIAEINSGSARTKLWWDASSADQNILRLRPQGPMPTPDNEIFEMSLEEEAEHDAQQAAAKKTAADEQAARLKDRAGFNPNYRFAPSQSETSNSTRPSTSTSNRFRRANLGDQAYDQVARDAQIMREREAEAEHSILGAKYERNQNENLAKREERNAGDLRSELDTAKVKLRKLEEQVTSDVLQRISYESELKDQEALERAQQVRSNANQRLNTAQERLVEAKPNSKLYELAQIKKGAAQADYRIASAREDQAQTRVELATIRHRTNAIKREISSQPSTGIFNRFRRANLGEQAYDQVAHEAQIMRERASSNSNHSFAPSQSESSNSTLPSTGTSNRFRRANLGEHAYDQVAREAQIMREREAEAEQSIPGAKYERNQSENLANREERKTEFLRSKLDTAKVKIRNLEEQVPSDVLQGISNAPELKDQGALKRAQQARSNANQRLNAAQERLVEAKPNSKLYELAQIKKDVAQADYRIASSREDQVQTKFELAKIRNRTKAIEKEIDSRSTESFASQVIRFTFDVARSGFLATIRDRMEN